MGTARRMAAKSRLGMGGFWDREEEPVVCADGVGRESGDFGGYGFLLSVRRVASGIVVPRACIVWNSGLFCLHRATPDRLTADGLHGNGSEAKRFSCRILNWLLFFFVEAFSCVGVPD
jgi:hypothetical protein